MLYLGLKRWMLYGLELIQDAVPIEKAPAAVMPSIHGLTVEDPWVKRWKPMEIHSTLLTMQIPLEIGYTDCWLYRCSSTNLWCWHWSIPPMSQECRTHTRNSRNSHHELRHQRLKEGTAAGRKTQCWLAQLRCDSNGGSHQPVVMEDP